TTATLTATAHSFEPLAEAETRAADLELLRAQLGRLGGTVYRLRCLEATIEGRPMVPNSLLNRLRRELVVKLDQAASAPPDRSIAAEPVLPALLEPIAAQRQLEVSSPRFQEAQSELVVLCRRLDQIEAALNRGISTIYADFQDIRQYAAA